MARELMQYYTSHFDRTTVLTVVMQTPCLQIWTWGSILCLISIVQPYWRSLCRLPVCWFGLGACLGFYAWLNLLFIEFNNVLFIASKCCCNCLNGSLNVFELIFIKSCLSIVFCFLFILFNLMSNDFDCIHFIIYFF